MYGKYNSDTLMEWINMFHQMQNITTWKEQMFISKMNAWLKCKLENIRSEFNYSMDAVLFLTTIKEKYIRMYEKFINELRSYLKAIRIPIKGISSYILNHAIKTKGNFATGTDSNNQIKSGL